MSGSVEVNNNQIEKAWVHLKRDFLWETKYKSEVQLSMDEAMIACDVDAPWDEINKDPIRLALARAIFTSELSRSGPDGISSEIASELNRRAFGGSYADASLSGGIFSTANHKAKAVKIFDLDSYEQPIEGSPETLMNMPTFPRGSDGKPSIGNISPIRISLEDNQLLLRLSTPSGHIWTKRVEVLDATFGNQLVGDQRGVVRLETISQTCVSHFRPIEARPTCSENCFGCSFTRGKGYITTIYENQVVQTISLLTEDELLHGHIVQKEFSGGSLNHGDGGFASAQGKDLAKLDEIIKVDVPVETEVEVVLPTDRNEWKGVIDQLKRYARKGMKISIAANLETPIDADRKVFLRGKLKGATIMQDLIDFANFVKEETDGSITVNTLLMFGMKRPETSWSEYMALSLKAIKILIANGITADLVPFKSEPGKTEALPPVDPIDYLILCIALEKMRIDAKLPYSPGCVGSCGLCHNREEIKALIEVIGNTLPKKLEKLLDRLGPEFTEAFIEIFTVN